MSPRAACRLERLGFTAVYDYVAGKMDWLSFALPHEGRARLVGAVARQDVPTCGPDDRVGIVRRRFEGTASAFNVVVNEQRVVLGLLQEGLAEAPADATAEQLMDFGITTVRLAEEVGPLTDRMARAHVEAIVKPVRTAVPTTSFTVMRSSGASGGPQQQGYAAGASCRTPAGGHVSRPVGEMCSRLVLGDGRHCRTSARRGLVHRRAAGLPSLTLVTVRGRWREMTS